MMAIPLPDFGSTSPKDLPNSELTLAAPPPGLADALTGLKTTSGVRFKVGEVFATDTLTISVCLLTEVPLAAPRVPGATLVRSQALNDRLAVPGVALTDLKR